MVRSLQLVEVRSYAEEEEEDVCFDFSITQSLHPFIQASSASLQLTDTKSAFVSDWFSEVDSIPILTLAFFILCFICCQFGNSQFRN